MGRLIDADVLIENLREIKTLYGVPMTNRDEQMIHWIIGHIKEQPTAYNVDKVVAELEDKLLSSSDAHAEAITGMCGASANVYYGEKSAYTSAIDIARKGGVE